MDLRIILFTLLVGVAAYFLADATTVKRREAALSLRRAKGYGGTDQRQAELEQGVGGRVVGPGVQRLAEVALRVTPSGSVDLVRRKLNSAGMSHVSPQSFLALKVVFSGVALALAVLSLVTANLIGFVIWGVAVPLGFMIPDSMLGFRIKSRREQLKSQLPDVLDLLTVSVEAGLGFDAAVLRISDGLSGPLVDEFSVMIHEMRIGETRSRALKNLGARVDDPDVSAFVRAIIQADQLGISLGRILRVQAADIRYRRQMAAEERAMKAAVKMLIPTAIFIFPAMFVVTIGPSMIGLIDAFTKQNAAH